MQLRQVTELAAGQLIAGRIVCNNDTALAFFVTVYFTDETGPKERHFPMHGAAG